MRKRTKTIRYSVRLSHAQAEKLFNLKQEIHARSDNEVFEYLVSEASKIREDIVGLSHSLYGDLTDHFTDRLQNLDATIQFQLALTDTFIKYFLTTLPEISQSQVERLREQAKLHYGNINLSAAREFQRRRESGAYTAEALGVEGLRSY
jgi:predicted HicB family RNase H-like nuclease